MPSISRNNYGKRASAPLSVVLFACGEGNQFRLESKRRSMVKTAFSATTVCPSHYNIILRFLDLTAPCSSRTANLLRFLIVPTC